MFDTAETILTPISVEDDVVVFGIKGLASSKLPNSWKVDPAIVDNLTSHRTQVSRVNANGLIILSHRI